jgi:predicted small integral membrane protein
MPVIRLCKVALVAAVAFFFTLVAHGNIADYNSNWQFVQHVLSMDTVFPDSTLRWRAITDPPVQELAYWLIIATQIAVAILLWVGVLRLLANLRSPKFDHARSTAVVGLTLGFLLYSVGFVSIGGEWFAMWQSETWNGDMKALTFLTMIALVLIVLLTPDSTSDRA